MVDSDLALGLAIFTAIIFGGWFLAAFCLSLIIPWWNVNWKSVALIGGLISSTILIALGLLGEEAPAPGKGKTKHLGAEKHDTRIYGLSHRSSVSLPTILPNGEIRCNLCGTVNRKHAKICRHCGAKLAVKM